MRSVEILVTASLPPFLAEPLQADYACHDYHAAPDKRGLLAAVGAAVRGLVQGGGSVTPEELLETLPRLEIISVFGVGYDGVPIDYCRRRGIKVTNTPDVLTDDVADVATGLVLMTGRGFAAAERFVRRGEWRRRGPVLTSRIGGRSAGILGLGRIGKAIARRLAALGMDIAYTGRRAQPDVPWRYVADLAALAAEVDFLIVACPVPPTTRMWLSSPRAVVANLILGHDAPAEAFEFTRSVNVPGISVAVGEMVAALRKVAGDAVADRVLWQHDPAVDRIISTWPPAFTATRGRALGMQADSDFESIVRAYIADDMPRG